MMFVSAALLMACGARSGVGLEVDVDTGIAPEVDGGVTPDVDAGTPSPRGSSCLPSSREWQRGAHPIPSAAPVGLSAAHDGTRLQLAWGEGGLRFSRGRGSGAWEEPTIIDTADASDAALAVGEDGRVHVAYYVRGQGLRHAQGRWPRLREATVDPGPETGVSPSIAIDGAGNAHVGYLNRRSATLQYASIGRDGAVSIETVDRRPGAGHIAIDPGGQPHIVFAADDTLWHARRSGRAWTVDEIDTGPRVQDESFVFDPAGVGHVAYGVFPEGREGELRYASLAPSRGWRSEVVDAERGGKHTSTTVDDGLGVHIAYWAQRGNDLFYATNVTGPWTTEPVDQEGRTGLYPTMMIASGTAWIVYSDATDGLIRTVSRTCAAE